MPKQTATARQVAVTHKNGVEEQGTQFDLKDKESLVEGLERVRKLNKLSSLTGHLIGEDPAHHCTVGIPVSVD